MCQRSNGFRVYNTRTGENFEASCGTYKCRECGPIKVWKLQKNLERYLKTWSRVRFWTFTMTSKHSSAPLEQCKQLAEAWQKFNTYMRRTKSMTESQRDFSYVRVIELHKSGYFHYHVLVDKYLPYEIVQNIWEDCCREVLKTTGHVAQAMVKGNIPQSVAARYVTKYVTKAIVDVDLKIRRYTTSRGVKLWEAKKSNPEWVCFKLIGSYYDSFEKVENFDLTLLVLKERNLTAKASANPSFFDEHWLTTIPPT